MKNLLSHRLLRARNLEKLPKMPWEITRLGLSISLSGSQVSFTNDGDYLSLSEAREAIKLLGEMLGMALVSLPTSRKVIEQDSETITGIEDGKTYLRGKK